MSAGVPTATMLKYSEIVDVDMAADNDVNFADIEDYGHRVVIGMDKIAMGDYLRWSRAVGAARPSVALDSTKEFAFKGFLETALSTGFVDIDGVTGGLHFGTDVMDLNMDTRLRANVNSSANDIPLAFILYKLYGSSSATTLGQIYNLEDAHGMIDSLSVATAITESFKASVSGSLNTMFLDLLAADPHRFFDVSGVPVTGIFETSTDVQGSGSWNIVNDDIIEVKLKFIFKSKVTRRGIAGGETNITSTDSDAAQNNQQTIINPEDYFYIRLQIKAF
jgi:hypothetical protein